MKKQIVLLAGKTESTGIVFNALKEEFDITHLIVESPPSKTSFLKNRIKKLGLLTVIGQIIFRVMIVPYLYLVSGKRIAEIKQEFALDENIYPGDTKIINVNSVNSEETISILSEINPTVIVINGTRIISKKVLDSVSAKFINMHAGITPLYRGVHGAYWALAEKQPESCGVTVHFVDPGIDTGNILAQGVISPQPKDTFVTYEFLQLATGIPLMKRVLHNLLENSLEIKPYPVGTSKLWSHPTFWEYLWYRLSLGVK